MKNFFMDVNFKRIVNAERRVNQGLLNLAITAAYTVEAYSHDFLRLDATGAQDVLLPDATTLPNGFDIKVQAVGAALNVKDASSPAAQSLKIVATDKTYGFRLLDNSTAGGTWLIYSAMEDAIPVAFVQNFTKGTIGSDSWGVAAGNVYTISYDAETVGKGANPLAVVYELDNSEIKPVGADLRIAADGAISIVADETVDMRFSGRLVVVQ